MSVAAEVLTSTIGMSRDEWLQVRRSGIGGSDVASIFGLSHWKSPMELYAEKIGVAPEKEQTWAMIRGTVLEEPLAQWLAEKYSVKVWRRNAVLQHPEYPWMLANIDRRVVGQHIGVECKTASPFAVEKWANGDAPIEYVLQCQHYMAVTGWDQWWLVYAIDGQDPQAILIERDEAVIDQLIKKELEFWFTHVLAEVPPTADSTESCMKALSWLYRNPVSASVIELPDEADVWIAEKHKASQALKDAKEREEYAKNMLRSMLGDYEVGLRNGEVAVTWKMGKKNRTLIVRGGCEDE